MENTYSFLEQIAAHSNDITFSYNPEAGKFDFLSNTTQEILKLSSAAIMAQPEKLMELVLESDRDYIKAGLQKIIKQEENHLDLEFRIHTSDQSIKWIRAKIWNLQKKQGNERYISGIIEDVTARKNYELGVLAIKEQKNIAIQVLGHDLRSPLNTISLSMHLMGREVDLEENKNMKELVEIVERTCRNSLDMIKEILNVEYIETQEMGIKKTRVDLVSRIQNQIDTFRLLDKSNKTFLFNSNVETLLASIDTVRLMLIFENLLTNAYKFTDRNGRIMISLEDQDGTVLISVADNGIGIPDRLKPMIFDKFTKARRKGTQGETPVGLGMHLIKTMVDQLEGRIWFESEEGKGSTFFVELPK